MVKEEAVEPIANFALRDRSALEKRLWLVLAELPDAEDDWEDTYRGQLTGLLFALGVDWEKARQASISLWDARIGQRHLPNWLESMSQALNA